MRLPDALLTQHPELARAHWRSGGLPPRIGGWLLGQPTVGGVTLWRVVFLAPGVGRDLYGATELLLHELGHVEQFLASGAFPFRYVWESLRHGYHRNRYEIEAQAYAVSRLEAARRASLTEDF
jgi:hypothetical protein